MASIAHGMPPLIAADYNPHSRASSASAPSSRPTSSHGMVGGQAPNLGGLGVPMSYEQMYHGSFPLGRPAGSSAFAHSHGPQPQTLPHTQPPHQQPIPTHTRHTSSTSGSQSTTYSLASTTLTTPADSPPSVHPGIAKAHPGVAVSVSAAAAAQNPQHLARTNSLRRARVGASPYSRDPHAQSGSESASETDELAMFLTAAPQDYGGIYNVPPNAAALDAVHPAGPYARMTLPPDNNLEALANNVKAATTTSASDRAKQIFVQAWLTVNYTSFPDGNVPRQGLYTSYRRVCDQYGIPHINTATLGKAIRLCFPAIKTRRLGVRGNSKYHYCGIRPNTAAEHDWLADYVRKSNNLNQAAQQQARVNAAAARNSAAAEESRSEDDDEDDESSEGAGSASSHHSPPNGLTVNTHKRANNLSLNGNLKSPVLYHMDTSSDKTPTVNSNSALSSAQARPQTSAFGGGAAQIRRRSLQPQLDPSGLEASASPPTNGSPAPPSYLAPHLQTLSVRHLPNFPSIDEAIGPQSSSPHGVAAREVWRWFEDHLDALLESVRSFRFDQFEIHLRTFWASLSGDHREVVHAPAVAGLMAKADAIVYDEILEILRSQMLSPIPAPALHSLRQLADKMEKILLLALDHYGNTFVEPKVELGARFGHLVLRFLDIFQVTQALSRVLQSPEQLADMRRAWDSIDFESVRNQSALVCNCRHEDLVQLLEVDFLNMLDGLTRSPEPVRDVMAWADDCCERLMGTGRSSGEDRTTLSSRSVLIRWGYVTSQIMRDLTIRSDPAFGAFQILKLFLDDWIALNVLRSVALSTNSVAASVEPVIQQQFFTLSPMVGTDSSNMMNHTPTTSSMLAALNDPFPAGSDPLAYSGVNGNSFSNFMDSKPGGVSDDALGGHGSMSFSDFASSASGVGNASTNAAFDVSSFTQELVMTPSNSAVVGDEVVKDEVVG